MAKEIATRASNSKVARRRSRSRAAKKVSKKRAQANALLWAVDPAERDLVFNSKVAEVASLWARTLDTEVTPLSVISLANMPWFEDQTVPLKEILLPAAYNSVETMLKESKITNARAPRFLTVNTGTGSRRDMVLALTKAARRLKARMIVAATHGPQELGRFRFGGFTEKLIALSQVPVLAVNPNTEVPRKIENILLPTDLSPDAEKVFEKVLELAKEIEARIKLLHINNLAYRSLNFAGDWGMSFDPAFITEAINETQNEKKRISALWRERASDEGVACEESFVSSLASLSESILEFERADEIDVTAMATYAGPIEQVILGSVARDVIHRATKPVLIVRAASNDK